MLRRIGFSRQKARQVHPSSDPKAQAAWVRRGLPNAPKATAEAHPDKRIALYFQDEAWMGQKGRVCHLWWLRGQRPPRLHHSRFEYAYVFAVVEPTTGNDLCLVLPFVSTAAMSVFLRDFSKRLAPDVHAVLVPTAPADMSPLHCRCRTTSPW